MRFSCLLLSLCLTVGFAQQLVVSTAVVEGQPVQRLLLDKKVVLDFYTYSPKRIDVIKNRLEKSFQRGWEQQTVVAKLHGNLVLLVGSALIVTVDPKEAEARDLSLEELAHYWLKQLKKALLSPTLFLIPDSLLVPVREFRQVKVGGTAQGKITLSGCDNIIAFCILEDESIKVYGTQVGNVQLRIERNGVYTLLPIRVREYAAEFLSPRPIIVTGRNFPISLLQKLIEQKVKELVVLKDGSQISKLRVIGITPPDPGKSVAVAARVWAKGRGYIPIEKRLALTISNELITIAQPRYLVLSNEPEVVKETGMLSTYSLTQQSPLRYLVHHKNGMRRSMLLAIEVENPTDKKALLHFISAKGGPNRSELSAGFKAAYRFLYYFVNQIGEVIPIPKESKKTIFLSLLPAHRTLSFAGYLQLLQGSFLYVKVSFADPREQESIQPIPLQPSPRWGVFSDALIQKELSYVVGEKWGFLPIGIEKVRDVYNGQFLSGNYGLWYNVTINITNPTAQKREVLFSLDASAGVTAGVFFINGKWIKVPYLASQKEKVLYRTTIQPLSKKKLTLATIPVGGGHYPARLIIHAK